MRHNKSSKFGSKNGKEETDSRETVKVDIILWNRHLIGWGWTFQGDEVGPFSRYGEVRRRKSLQEKMRWPCFGGAAHNTDGISRTLGSSLLLSKRSLKFGASVLRRWGPKATGALYFLKEAGAPWPRLSMPESLLSAHMSLVWAASSFPFPSVPCPMFRTPEPLLTQGPSSLLWGPGFSGFSSFLLRVLVNNKSLLLGQTFPSDISKGEDLNLLSGRAGFSSYCSVLTRDAYVCP